ncbi:hypothetical protein BJ138DRAFT_499317 [Hygrophoropsis aurantiaca]|uniref:Uncharacterized protein n=1 Tax=Hygrophoropsis aurantiaca TaxID=72124 RepID=A0ACB8A366_9AGAM|nr:hypothetical protein BJ138DRAFT_499317 [Hygrophoropsis aurantiaca]
MQVLSRTPMRSDSLYTHAPRASRSAEVGMIPPRKGPLIFAAMASINQHNDSVTIASATPSRPVEIDATAAPQAYPSPPAEVVPLDRRSTERHHRANDPSTTSGPDTRAQAQRLSPSPFEKDPQGSAPVVPFEPILPTRVRKLSKAKSLAREGSDHSVRSATSNEKSGVGSESPKVSRVLTKARPITPSSPKTSEKLLVEHDPSLTDSLLLDADPFAKAEGVQMVKSVKMSSSGSSSRDEGVMQMSSSAGSLPSTKNSDENAAAIDAPATPGHPQSPPTPVSPEEYKIARAQRRGQFLEKSLPPLVADMIAKQEFHEDEPEEMIEEEMVEEEEEVPPKPPTYFPIVPFLSDVTLLPLFLPYLSFSDWCALYSTTKEVQVIFESRLMREKVLERYLKTVGYVHWTYEWAEPLALSLKVGSVLHARCL